MLIPKGTGTTFAAVLFVMVTDDSLTVGDDDQPDPKCKDAASYCGLRDTFYPDK
jgi:hypothetical protein